MKIVVGLVFLLGLIYLSLPGPEKIDEFSRLPLSLKSQLAGDTIQNPNIAAYFSDYPRSFVVPFYVKDLKRIYCKKHLLDLPNPLCFFPMIRLNHPPEKAFVYIRDQEESTFLEEYLYPFRESFFINGYEPFDKNGKQFDYRSKPLEVDKKLYFSKTTIRFYTSNVWNRIVIYLGIWGALFLLFKTGRMIIKNG